MQADVNAISHWFYVRSNALGSFAEDRFKEIIRKRQEGVLQKESACMKVPSREYLRCVCMRKFMTVREKDREHVVIVCTVKQKDSSLLNN